jgi:hypothetical protein
LSSDTSFKNAATANGYEDDAPACTTSVTIDLKSVLGPQMDFLRESKQGALPTSSPYPRYTTGVLLFPGTNVRILHGRSDGHYRVQVGNSCDAVSMYEVNLCLQHLFTDASKVRIQCLKISFKVRDFYAVGNGSSGSASSPRPRQEGKRATPEFPLNAAGLPWYVEWDAYRRSLQILVEVDRDFLAGFGIVALRDVVGLRRLKLGELLSPEDIEKLPVPRTFSTSREVLSTRLQRMLAEFNF